VEKPLPELLAIENLQNYFSSYSSYEIEKLQDALKTLINTIQNQIGQISTSNELLSLQNEELVGMNEKLSESESKLQEALFVKDKFFSIIAHDLKGPMASLTSFLKLFIRYNDSFSKEETKEVAQKMQASTESLSELLENLLTWSRAQIGHIQLKPVKVDLEEVVDKNFELILPKTSKKNISLIKEITPEIFLWADVDVLHFVLRNLLNNAVKFSHQDGKITVFSEVKGDFVWVSVKDEGVGMSEEMIQNLFNPRVKSSTKGTDNEQGTGLGLLLCKDFITSNRGEIWVESQENHGSIFTFLLPKYAYQWVEDGKKNKEAAKGN